MRITYKKANDAFKALQNKWAGVKYGIMYAHRIKDKIVVTHHGKPILFITKENKYEYVSINNEAQRKFYNKYTPISIRKRKLGWYVGRQPFYIGIKVDSKGDMIIPQVYSRRGDVTHCRNCDATYTENLCIDCYEDYLEDDGW
jgi:hypothetical protein